MFLHKWKWVKMICQSTRCAMKVLISRTETSVCPYSVVVSIKKSKSQAQTVILAMLSLPWELLRTQHALQHPRVIAAAVSSLISSLFIQAPHETRSRAEPSLPTYHLDAQLSRNMFVTELFPWKSKSIFFPTHAVGRARVYYPVSSYYPVKKLCRK